MEMKLLKEEIKEIEMPQDMRERIIENCRQEGIENKENEYMRIIGKENNVDIKDNVIENMSENRISQKKGKFGKKWPRIATVAAAVTLCLGLGGITVMAASGKLEGFFTDVTRWDGAVVGTTYEQATEEIEVSAAVSGDNLIVDAVLLKADEAPYVTFDSFGIQTYRIVDDAENVVVEGITSETTDIAGGKVSTELPLDELESGGYTLIITEFVGNAKAEQPLTIGGYWVCEFEL